MKFQIRLKLMKLEILAKIDEILIFFLQILGIYIFLLIFIYTYLLDLALHMQQPFADRKTFGL